MTTPVVEKIKSFRLNLHQYLFGGTTGVTTPLTAKPTKWGISIHDGANNPFSTGANVDSTWFTATAKRKAASYINAWVAIGSNYENGVANQAEITFDFVPAGSPQWNINYFVIWAIVGSGNTPVPLYAGQFTSTINLNPLQILYISAGNLTILEN